MCMYLPFLFDLQFHRQIQPCLKKNNKENKGKYFIKAQHIENIIKRTIKHFTKHVYLFYSIYFCPCLYNNTLIKVLCAG